MMFDKLKSIHKDFKWETKAHKLGLASLLISQVFTPLAIASEQQRASDSLLKASGNMIVQGLNKFGHRFNVKWAESEFSVRDGDSEYGITAFSVLKETSSALFLSQVSISKKSNGSTFNVGLANRQLIETPSFATFLGDKNIIVGANAFVDFKSGTDGLLKMFGSGVHKRYSLGAELKASKFDLYSNIYRGITKSIGGQTVIDGYDYGFNFAIPKLKNITVGLTSYSFSGDTKKEKGDKFSIQYKPNALLTLGAEHDQATGTNVSNNSLYANIKFALGVPLDEQLETIKSTSSNAWTKRYDRINRTNRVHVEVSEVVVAKAPTVTATKVEWGTDVVLTPVKGQEYRLQKSVTGITFDDKTFTITATKPGSVILQTRVTALKTRATAAVDDNIGWTGDTVITFDKQSVDKPIVEPEITIKSIVFDTTKEVKLTIVAGNEYRIEKAVDGIKLDEKTGVITATKPGTVRIQTRTKETDLLDASPWSIGYDVVFTKAKQTVQATPVTVDNDSVEIGTAITITNILETQEYELLAPVPKNITLTNGIINSSETGTVTIRTRLKETDEKLAGDWTAGKSITFTKVKKVVDVVQVTLDTKTAVWGKPITITNLTPGQEYELVTPVTAGITYNESDGKINAVNPGTVKIKTRVTGTADIKESDWSAEVEVTFTKQTQTAQATPVTVDNDSVEMGKAITITNILETQEYELLAPVPKNITLTNGIINSSEIGTVTIRTRLKETDKKLAGDWTAGKGITFTKVKKVVDVVQVILDTKTAVWGKPITITNLTPGQEYKIVKPVAGITYNEIDGTFNAENSGTVKMQTRVTGTADIAQSDWSPEVEVEFSRQVLTVIPFEWGTRLWSDSRNKIVSGVSSDQEYRLKDGIAVDGVSLTLEDEDSDSPTLKISTTKKATITIETRIKRTLKYKASAWISSDEFRFRK